jgi:hypothetical protein
MLFVKNLTKQIIESAMRSIVTVENGKWLSVYGS